MPLRSLLRRTRSAATAALMGAVAVAAIAVTVATPAQAQETPEGFEQLLARGAIASIDAPEWVAADTATIPDDAFVLGVVVEGQARAFSINLLNAHEIVNDKIGDTAYAAVW